MLDEFNAHLSFLLIRIMATLGLWTGFMLFSMYNSYWFFWSVLFVLIFYASWLWNRPVKVVKAFPIVEVKNGKPDPTILKKENERD